MAPSSREALERPAEVRQVAHASRMATIIPVDGGRQSCSGGREPGENPSLSRRLSFTEHKHPTITGGLLVPGFLCIDDHRPLEAACDFA